MNPNGFVAAASTTSQMSIPIRSQSCASSLTSAMLTERKMFSRSFVSSAASGDETRWIVSTASRRALPRRRSTPRRCRRRPSARSSSSSRRGPGRRARARRRGGSPVPATRPDSCSSTGRSSSRVVPGYVVDSSTTRWPGRRRVRSRRRAASDDREVGLALLRERRRQGDQDRVGVAQHVVVGRRARGARSSTSCAERLGRDVLDVALAAAKLLRRGPASTSTSTTLRPASAKTCASGTPT